MTALLLLLIGLGQIPRDTAQTPATGTLAGVITSADGSHMPLRRARVTCSGPAAAAARTTVTDDQGSFAFTRLPAGRYTVRASREGWLAMTYGARTPLGGGASVAVANDSLTSVSLELPRAAVIAGTLLDDDGLPVTGVNVRAFRFVGDGTGRHLSGITAAATTDDRGDYRLFGLMPGTYIVGADAARTRAAFSSQGELHLATDIDVGDADTSYITPQPNGVDYAAVYYPGTTMPAEAAVVAVGAGEERDGLDFSVQLVGTSRVRGFVSMPGGLPASAGTVVTIAAFEPDGSPPTGFDDLRTTRTGDDGTFEFFNVPPGNWRVIARRPGPPSLSATADVITDGGPVDGTMLTLSNEIRVSGRVVFGEAASDHPDPAAVRVVLEPTVRSAGLTAAVAAIVRPDGRFEMAGVLPGDYRLVATLPAGAPGRSRWALRSATLLGQETLDRPVRIGAGTDVGDAIVAFSDRMADVSGTVAPPLPPGSRIVLFPTDASLYEPDAPRVRSAVAAEDGTYLFRGVLPGSYFVALTDDPEPNAWRDGNVLRSLATTAVTVDVADGRSVVQNLVKRR